MAVTGARGAALLKEAGVSRIVTARELSLKEIHEIYKETGMEIESFVHGALCYCYSGMCLFSSMLGGRSGNRGRCAQPCRLPYTAYKGREQISQEEQDVYKRQLLKLLKQVRLMKMKSMQSAVQPLLQRQ